MCLGCLQEYGNPKIDNELVRSGVKAVEKVYEFSCVGGNLHVQLDDFNIEDEFFETFEPFLDEMQDGQLEAEKECFDLFQQMTLAERASVLGWFENNR